MAVEKYTQEERAFIQRAVMSGFSMDDAYGSIARKRKKESVLGKIATTVAGAAPVALGAAGGMGGLLLGTVPGAALGGFAGVAGGRALEDMILKAAGLRTETGEEGLKRVGGAAKEGAIGAATNVGALLTGRLLSKLLRPLKTGGQLREATLKGRTLPGREFAETVYGGQEKALSVAPTKTQQAGRNIARKLFEEVAPMQTVGEGGAMRIVEPADVSINKIYESLTKLGRTYAPYAKESAEAQAAKAVDIAAREYLTGQIPGSAQRLNQLLSALYKLQPYTKRAAYGAAGAGGAAVGWGLLGGRIKDILGVE